MHEETDATSARSILGVHGPRVARWAKILEQDEDFRRWYRNLASGSGITAGERARVPNRFPNAHGLSPRGFAE